jgi:hypothetical protein
MGNAMAKVLVGGLSKQTIDFVSVCVTFMVE